jgi:hypothetical protein
VSEDEPGPWPVLLSETAGDMLADPALPGAVFSAVVALTVAIAQNPWLEGSQGLEDDPDWREILIPHGYGIAEYRINRADRNVILTRIVAF